MQLMMIASTQTPNDAVGNGGVRLVVGALACLPKDVVEQAYPDVYAQCTGAQDYRFQILFSREESLRLHWNTPVHLMSLQQKQGVYKLHNLPEWDVLKDAVGKAEKGELQASGSDSEAVRLHLATALKHVEQSGER